MNRSFLASQAPAQAAYNEQVGFLARTVLVDNPGGQWVHVPGANNLYVPPYTAGVVAPLTTGTTTARLDTVPPAGQVVNSSGLAATVTFTDEQLAPSSGTPYTSLQLANALTTVITGASTTPLTFFAKSITVENPGGQWIQFPDLNYIVPPWTRGVVIPLGGGSKAVNVTLTPPTGQVNTLTGNAPAITFTDMVLPAASGAPFGPNLSQAAVTSQLLNLFTAAGAGSTATLTLNVVPNGQARRVVALSVNVFMAKAAHDAVAQNFQVSIVYGATLIWAGQVTAGSGQAAAVQVAAKDLEIVFPVNAQPPFVGDGVNGLAVTVGSPEGTIVTNGWQIQFMAVTYAVTL